MFLQADDSPPQGGQHASPGSPWPVGKSTGVPGRVAAEHWQRSPTSQVVFCFCRFPSLKTGSWSFPLYTHTPIHLSGLLPHFSLESLQPLPVPGQLTEERLGDSPDPGGLARASCPGQLVALPGTVLSIRFPRAMALLVLFLLIVIELLDAVLVAYLQQVGIGLQVQGGRMAVLLRSP